MSLWGYPMVAGVWPSSDHRKSTVDSKIFVLPSPEPPLPLPSQGQHFSFFDLLRRRRWEKSGYNTFPSTLPLSSSYLSLFRIKYRSIFDRSTFIISSSSSSCKTIKRTNCAKKVRTCIKNNCMFTISRMWRKKKKTNLVETGSEEKNEKARKS